MSSRADRPSPPTRSTINEEAARLTGVDVGDAIVLNSYAADQVDIVPRGDIEDHRRARPSTPRWSASSACAEDISDDPEPIVVLSTAFHDAYADQIAHCDCSFAIAADQADVAAVTAAIEGLIGDYPLAVHEINSDLRGSRVDRAVSLEVGALPDRGRGRRVGGCTGDGSGARSPRHVRAEQRRGAPRHRCDEIADRPLVDPDHRCRSRCSAPSGAVSFAVVLSPAVSPRAGAGGPKSIPGFAWTPARCSAAASSSP